MRRMKDLERENEGLRKDARHTDTLHRAALKHPVEKDRGPL